MILLIFVPNAKVRTLIRYTVKEIRRKMFIAIHRVSEAQDEKGTYKVHVYKHLIVLILFSFKIMSEERNVLLNVQLLYRSLYLNLPVYVIIPVLISCV